MSEHEAPSLETLRRARVFWEQSCLDLKGARRKLRAGAYLESGYASLQAALNALSAVCYLQGHLQQLPQSSTMRMLVLCRESHPSFELLDGACEALEEAAEQNPFAPHSQEDGGKAAAKARLEQSGTVINTVRAYLKSNRKRFFAP